MGFIDWRSGVWLLTLGLLGLLLPVFGGLESSAVGWVTPAWPFFALVTLGAALTGIGVYNRLKGRR
ncbi:MAG: hypothetical protein A2Y64_06835 [Candidatus Coatesbacteria bacterium RBG_13_66_14]|uniref:Uncharacterized protein n=1 Tax=Candidatus Coatesbacteria bacterium RBG_13_66_14 TaxID=1817816 RepID=A0A1F5EY20_9BACT|nr:MAG: hypothetical protein A2Y64_06835 [Candidatus Coatesbacteria bacterium RBG_13_66_14]